MNTVEPDTKTSLADDLRPFELTGAERPGPAIVVCEHASSWIPERLSDLGLAPEHRLSHAVWDIGAAVLAKTVAERLNAPLLTAGTSRLVIDLNRPPEAPDAMPGMVEVIEVPGNRDLAPAQRQSRIDSCYRPFHAKLGEMLDRATAPVLITVHSFTPSWKGTDRPTRIGLLHDADARLATAMLEHAEHPRTELNKPYSSADGVTHLLKRHATSRGIPNVMIEVRNDLLSDDAAIEGMAEELLALLMPALEQVT